MLSRDDVMKLGPASLCYERLGSHWVEISNIHVEKQYRKQGYGTRVLLAFLEQCDELSLNVKLLVATSGEMSNEELTDWYRQFDFESINDWRMERRCV